MDIETRERIKELYIADKITIADIAREVGRSKTSVDTYIRRCIKKGEIEYKDKRKTPKPRKMTTQPQPQFVRYEPDGVTVKCTKTVAKRCYYGASDPNHLCDYFNKTGITRYNPEIIKKYGLTSCSNCNLFVSKKGNAKRKPRPFEVRV